MIIFVREYYQNSSRSILFICINNNPLINHIMRKKILLFITLAFTFAYGLATESPFLRGDVDGNGQVTIADVSEVISVILEGHDNTYADINGDSQVNVVDLSDLIDIILHGPDLRICTYLLVSMSNGNADEYLVDGSTKVNVSKPNLVIEADGQVITYLLSEVKQLRYEDRIVSFDSKSVKEYMLDDDSQTLKTGKP